MTAIQTGAAGFSQIRTRLYPPNLAGFRGFWRFGVDATTSAVNLVPEATQTGAFSGANINFGAAYAEFTGTDSGFDSGLMGGDEPFTMFVLATRPVIGGGETSGQYAGYYDSAAGLQAALSYQGGSNTNFNIDFTNVVTQAYSQGASYAMLVLTNDGDGGLAGHVTQSGAVLATYTRTLDSDVRPFLVGLAKTAATGTGSNAHTTRVHSVGLMDVALDAEEIAEQYACFGTWAADLDLPLA